jgi:serine protease Do
MTNKATTLLLALTAALTILAGCGPDPVQRSESGSLEAGDSTHPHDGSFYDEYTFRAKEGWRITLTMTSAEFQPYLQLRMKDQGDEGLVEQPGANGTAVLNTTAGQTTEYIIWANSNQAGETGAYTLLISAQP